MFGSEQARYDEHAPARGSGAHQVERPAHLGQGDGGGNGCGEIYHAITEALEDRGEPRLEHTRAEGSRALRVARLSRVAGLPTQSGRIAALTATLGLAR